MVSVTELLQQLVRIPSVNPDGDPGTDQCGEEALANWLGEYLTAQGFRVTLEEIQPGRPNLLARSPGPPGDSRPRVVLGPHLDTVGVGGMTIDPFGAELRDGKLWGRGASDTKGSMAAMIWGLLSNREQLADLPVAVDLVAFMSEESDQWGSKHFVKAHGRDYDFAIAGEPTGLDLVHVTKGSLWATLHTTGLSGHASQPELGDNAIMKLVRALAPLESELASRLAEFTHPVLGHATLNVGMFHGGTRANIIPDQASAEIDIRFPPALVESGSAREFLESFLAERGYPLTITGPDENPPMEVPSGNKWLRRILAIHPQSQLVGAPWFSDAAHLNAGGLPAICLGPGSIRQAHTKDEFISLSDLQAGADFFTKLIAGLQAS